MPWWPLSRIAFAVATFPFQPSLPADLPLEIGDELYIIEQGGADGAWYRGYLVAPPSLLAGLTSRKGQTLEARVFSGIFPRCCVEVREVLGDTGTDGELHTAGLNQEENLMKRINGDLKHSHSPLRSDNSLRRHLSKSKPGRTRQAVADGGSPKGTAPGISPTRSSSQRKARYIQDQNLGRTLSHRSVTSRRSRQSILEPEIMQIAPRQPGAQRAPAPVPMLKIGDETPTSSTEPLVDEIASCLREWHSKNLHELLLTRQYSLLDRLTQLVYQLDLSRRQLLHGVLTDQEVDVVREKTVWDLVAGNKVLSNEIIVRDPKQRGRLLIWGDSIVEMSKLQSTMSLLEKPPAAPQDPFNLYHLCVELKGSANAGLNSPTMTLEVFSRKGGQKARPLTEAFVIDLPTQDQFEKVAMSGIFRTLIVDITSNDLGESSGADIDLFLVARVQENQLVQSELDLNRSDGDIQNVSEISHSQSPSPSQGKAGRQSLMWAQKQLGNTRNRNRQDGKMFRAIPNARPTTPSDAKSRPSTGNGLQTPIQQGPQYARKLVAVGVLNIKSLFGRNSSADLFMPMWSPAKSRAEKQRKEDHHELIRELALGDDEGLVRSKSIETVRFNLTSYISPDADDLIAQTPTLLQNIIQTPTIGFAGAPKRPRSDIYITINEAALSNPVLLSHPERGPVQISSSFDLKNIQVRLEVRKTSGELLEHCIFPFSNRPAQTAWRTTTASLAEPWNQTVKLVIPDEHLPEAYLIMIVADAPGFPFALGWMPLWDQGAFIQDGVHQPLLYLYDKVTSGSDNGRRAYLAYPWGSASRKDLRPEASRNHPARLRIETHLCSTTFSQDEVLLGLFRWRDLSGRERFELMKRFVFVPEIEVVKSIDEVFKALFGILVEHAGADAFESLAFTALVTLLGIVHDRRFSLGPLVDEYAETKFDYPGATPCLLRSYLRLLASPADPANSRQLRATFKVGRQILKFIVNARKRQQSKEADVGITSTQSSFESELRNVFISLENLMRDPSPTLVGSKTLVVQHFHTWLPELAGTFSEEVIFEIACSFLDSAEDVRGKLILFKLVLISNLANVAVLNQDQIKGQLHINTVRWIDRYWGSIEEHSDQWREQIRLCCSIISAQIDYMDSDVCNVFMKVIQSYRWIEANNPTTKESLSLLFPTSYPFPSKAVSTTSNFDEPLIELAALLARLGQKPLSEHLPQSNANLSNTLFDALDVVKSILGGNAYPDSWLSLHVFHHRASLQILNSILDVMLQRFLPSPDDADDFNTELWSSFLLALLTLVSSNKLTLETFPEQKRRAVWKIAGDVREQGAGLLSKSWQAIGWEAGNEDQSRYGVSRLGGFQVQYVPTLVSPIVELCLSVHEGLRNVAVRILQTMIISEWTLSEDLSVIQAEVINCLDSMFKTKNLAEGVSQKLFVTELLELFENIAHSPGDPLWQAIKDMLAVVDELVELLGAVYSTDITEAFRIMHTLRLMDFLKDMQKQDIYIRYVHQLADIQAKLHNNAEAGLALRLHADMYSWDATALQPLTDPNFREQTSFERKEQIYFEMIKHFEEGASWVSALSSYQELAAQYENNHYDFAKLARTYRSMAKIHESITKWERPMPRYFRVIYRGLGFPTSLRDKQFIFEAGSAERISSFTDRMRQQHPAAQIAPAGDDEFVEGQYLQVFPVSPHRNLDHNIYQQSRVPHSVREFILSAQPRRFAVTSRRHSPVSGVKDQWIEKTIYTTSEAFPTISKRSEIIAIDTVRLSPLQTAVERTSRKTAEIASLEKRIVDGDDSVLSSLTEAIKSSVDPTSVASVAQYRGILPAYPESREEDQAVETPSLDLLQNALKLSLVDHASTIKHALTTLARHNITDHPSLSINLQTSFAPELATLAPATEPSPPPTSYVPTSPMDTPSDPHSSSIGNVTTRSTPQLPIANGTITDELQRRPTLEANKRNSLLSLSFLKSSSQSVPKTNGSASRENEDNKSTSTFSHKHDENTAPSSSAGRSGSQSLSRASGWKTVTNGDETGAEEAERPMTSPSSRSGRVRRRLSLLGIGAKQGSVKKRAPAQGSMGMMAEE